MSEQYLIRDISREWEDDAPVRTRTRYFQGFVPNTLIPRMYQKVEGSIVFSDALDARCMIAYLENHYKDSECEHDFALYEPSEEEMKKIKEAEAKRKPHMIYDPFVGKIMAM